MGSSLVPFQSSSAVLEAQYGIAVTATEFPSFVEIYEAIETGVGAGTYGTSVSVGKITAVGGDVTRWVGRAPINGLRRQLKARHVRDGQTASAFTAVVTVNPGVAVALLQVQRLPASLALSIGTCYASNAGVAGPPYNQLEVAFTATNMPVGTTFDVSYNNGGANIDSQAGLTSSPATFTGVTFNGSAGSGAVTVLAQYNGVTIATAIKNKPYAI